MGSMSLAIGTIVGILIVLSLVGCIMYTVISDDDDED